MSLDIHDSVSYNSEPWKLVAIVHRAISLATMSPYVIGCLQHSWGYIGTPFIPSHDFQLLPKNLRISLFTLLPSKYFQQPPTKIFKILFSLSLAFHSSPDPPPHFISFLFTHDQSQLLHPPSSNCNPLLLPHHPSSSLCYHPTFPNILNLLS